MGRVEGRDFLKWKVICLPVETFPVPPGGNVDQDIYFFWEVFSNAGNNQQSNILSGHLPLLSKVLHYVARVSMSVEISGVLSTVSEKKNGEE